MGRVPDVTPVIICIELLAVPKFRAQDVIEQRDVFRYGSGGSVDAKIGGLLSAREFLWTQLDLRADKGVISVAIGTVVCSCDTNVDEMLLS